jgi:hypothetical protein
MNQIINLKLINRFSTTFNKPKYVIFQSLTNNDRFYYMVDLDSSFLNKAPLFTNYTLNISYTPKLHDPNYFQITKINTAYALP